MDKQIHEHLVRLGIDRWNSLRGTVTTARDLAEQRGHRQAVLAFNFVLGAMADAEKFEETATEIKRAELTGDIEGMLKAMARL